MTCFFVYVIASAGAVVRHSIDGNPSVGAFEHECTLLNTLSVTHCLRGDTSGLTASPAVINAVGGMLFTVVAPDLEDRGTVIGVSIVLGVLMIGAALWLCRGSRWGGIATIAVNVFNVLLTIPAFFEADAAVMVGGAVSLVLSVATAAFVLHPESRAFWQRRIATA